MAPQATPNPPQSTPAAKRPTRENYDESKVTPYTLPDLLTLKNGQKVTDAETWLKQRRPEIMKDFEEVIYGRCPAQPELFEIKDFPKTPATADRIRMAYEVIDQDRDALGGKAVRKQINLSFPDKKGTPVIHIPMFTPKQEAPAPLFLCLSFSPLYGATTDPAVKLYPTYDRKAGKQGAVPENPKRGNSKMWRVNDTLAHGYGIAIIDYNDIEADYKNGDYEHGIRPLILKPGQTELAANEWGAIGAWGWGLSRALDYMLTDKDVDGKKVIACGQSRLGKTVLWAGAMDQRFAMVVASCSGEGGAKIARRNYGETIDEMVDNYPYQFCGNYKQWKGHWNDMPVDGHSLVALIAPRPLYLNTGSLDKHSDPKGEFVAAVAAEPVYNLMGKKGLGVTEMPPLDVPVMHDIAFQIHTGQHDILPPDWERFWAFADYHLKGKPLPEKFAQTK